MKKELRQVAGKPTEKPPAGRNGRRTVHPTTTAEVLGLTGGPAPARKPTVPRRWAREYRILQRLRAGLREDMGQLSQDAKDEAPNYSEHMADAGTDSFDRDFALGLFASEQEAVNEIDQALRRIESGTYGVCELTGQPIPKPRLEAIPWTRYSLEAQRELERTGTVARPHVGGLRAVESGAGEAGEAEESEEPERS